MARGREKKKLKKKEDKGAAEEASGWFVQFRPAEGGVTPSLPPPTYRLLLLLSCGETEEERETGV